MKIFAERLKELRLEEKLSMDELAKRAGVSKMAISRWESGEREPSFRSAILLAKYFKVTTDYLAGLED